MIAVDTAPQLRLNPSTIKKNDRSPPECLQWIMAPLQKTSRMHCLWVPIIYRYKDMTTFTNMITMAT